MANDLKIEDIKILDVSPGDTIIVTVDLSLMPQKRAEEYMRKIVDALKPKFPDNEIIISANTVKFETADDSL